jgi:hypothetical protein
MRLITIFTLILSVYYANGQTLLLDDIFNIRTMDSTTLRGFCHEKGFELREVEIDVWRSMHKYYSSTDSSIWFSRNFPTGKKLFSNDQTSGDYRRVSYHFVDENFEKQFLEKIKESGFRFKRTYASQIGRIKFTHNEYVNKADELIIDLSEILKEKKLTFELICYKMSLYEKRKN